MKINSKLNRHQNSLNFKGSIYNSKLFKKSLVFASENPALYCGALSLMFSSVARPLAILSAPKTDIENKKYAISKSISSSIIGYLLMFAITKPFSHAVKNIDLNPLKYLNNDTIKNLQNGTESLNVSKKYKFATQLFKLGLGLLIAVPKSTLTAYLTPKIMKKFFKKDNNNNSNNKIQFKGSLDKIYNSGINKLSDGIGALINTKTVQKLADKFQNTNYERNFMYLTDAVLTGVFVNKTLKNKEIEEKRKKPLVYNSILSTVFSVLSSFVLDKLTQKPYEKFVSKFLEYNKNSAYLDKFKDGLKISKTALIMAGVYYILIPVASTFLADRIDNFRRKEFENK